MSKSLHPRSARARGCLLHEELRYVALRALNRTTTTDWRLPIERQRALDRSRSQAQRDLADPEIRRYLEESLRRLDVHEPAPPLTAEEFLAQTRLPDE